MANAKLLDAIRSVLAAAPFTVRDAARSGRGCKCWPAYVEALGAAAKHWVLRLMREHDILALGMAPTA